MFCGICTGPPSVVAFWDEGPRKLALVDRNRIPEKYSLLIIPRFKSTFNLYSPIGSYAYPHAISPIIPKDVADTEGRTFEAALHFDRLGTKANFLRAVSKQHRVLYVGNLGREKVGRESEKPEICVEELIGVR